jgi:hypothetical protein
VKLHEHGLSDVAMCRDDVRLLVNSHAALNDGDKFLETRQAI